MSSHASQLGGSRFLHTAVGRRLLSFTISRSRHGKRLFFITSLYSHVVRIEQMRAEAISTLNEIMGLAKREEAMRFPAAYHEVVWDNTRIDDVLNLDLLSRDLSEDQTRDLSRQVVELAPRWIRYDNAANMERDVYDLIHNGSLLAKAA